MKSVCRNALSLLLIISSASAAPTSFARKSFKIQRRQASGTSPDGMAALSQAYGKYGWKVPETLNTTVPVPQVHSAGDPGDLEEGEVYATPEEGDAAFLSPIQIGGQTLMMDFDTGSSDLWVFSTHLKPQQTRGHSVYDPAKSSTFKTMEGSTFKISYGDSSAAAGVVGTDTVNIGGAKVDNQAIELAVSITDSFTRQVDSDGLVGLAFSSINTIKPQKQKTFFENVQASLEKPLFTANLRHHTVGSYEFGRIDTRQFKGPLNYAPVDPSAGFWAIESKSYAIGDGAAQSNDKASPAIIDTGTSLILADDNVARSYWRQVEGATMDAGGGATFPCTAQLPDLHLALGPKYMAKVQGDLMSFQRLGGGKCFGGLQSNLGKGLQIYGDVLFKAQFVVFDAGNMAVGFAPHDF
ncbi:MAG: hypothetical protein Q9212_003874 [Teloschistes hypoglaucus]